MNEREKREHLINIRPFLGRSAHSVYERLEEKRTAVANHLKDELKRRGFDGLVVEELEDRGKTIAFTSISQETSTGDVDRHPINLRKVVE
jgi:hypothetical protein